MRKIVWIVVLLLMLAQCMNHQKPAENQESVIDNSTEALSSMDAVSQIYGEVFESYRKAGDAGPVVSCEELDRKFMSSAYLAVEAVIDSIDRLYPAEIGFHEYDHWIQAQDWDKDLSCSVDSLINENGDNSVWITITNCGTKKPLEVKVVKEDDQWKIDDFITDGISERQQMQEYIDANTKKGSAIS